MPEMFSTLCTVKADMSQLASVLKPQRGRGGAIYYQHYFDIVLLFGLTELKAQISWTEHVRDLCLCTSTSPDLFYHRAKKSGEYHLSISPSSTQLTLVIPGVRPKWYTTMT